VLGVSIFQIDFGIVPIVWYFCFSFFHTMFFHCRQCIPEWRFQNYCTYLSLN